MLKMKNSMDIEKLVPALVVAISISVIILIPLRIMGYGYLPQDDALRHAAKVVSGKSWSEILVLRDDIKMDNHPGWHSVLTVVHKFANLPPDGLVVFSVVSLFVLFGAVGIMMLKRPEGWLMTLTVVMLTCPGFIWRLFLGRPYIFTMSVLLFLEFLWPRLTDKKISYATLSILVVLFGASTWIHGSWFLFALPVACFFIARQWRAGLRICVSMILGIALGAILTGHPYLFLKESIYHAFRAFDSHLLTRMLVVEFRPFMGDNFVVVAVLGMLAWRKMRGDWDLKRVDNPIFILAIVGWVLGFISVRFWTDWGMPAVCIWMAEEFKEALEKRFEFSSLRRIFFSTATAVILFLVVTNDAYNHWTGNLTKAYLSIDDPEQRPWLPEPGGIVYSDDMTVFYDTFFTNPHAPWRYIVGYEPTMMPEEDLAIYRKIQWNFGAACESFEPWVKKMKPEDRLVLRRLSNSPPNISELKWHNVAKEIWVGRLPRD